MIIRNGNIIELIDELKLDSLQNAANGIGKPMGRGIARSIRDAGGIEIQDDAFNVCNTLNPQAGDAYKTISGKLEKSGIKCIIHAVTMKYPGGPTSYEIVEKAFKSALDLAFKAGITRLGCTSLGTGVGGLDGAKVAEIMYPIALKSPVEVVFVDIKRLNKLDGKK